MFYYIPSNNMAVRSGAAVLPQEGLGSPGCPLTTCVRLYWRINGNSEKAQEFTPLLFSSPKRMWISTRCRAVFCHRGFKHVQLKLTLAPEKGTTRKPRNQKWVILKTRAVLYPQNPPGHPPASKRPLLRALTKGFFYDKKVGEAVHGEIYICYGWRS